MKGVYCAKVSNISEATLCKSHNDANAIALSEDMNDDLMLEVVNKFIIVELYARVWDCYFNNELCVNTYYL